jgi:hypothetical protein
MANKIGGRPKGAKNILGGQAKENIAAVFTRLGGTAAMADWAKDNKSEFYKLYIRLLPVEGPGENGEHRHEIYAPWLSGRSL